MSEATPIPEDLLAIAEKYGVTVERYQDWRGKDEGSCAGNSIWLADFSDPDIERVAFFHELGHIVGARMIVTYGRHLSILACEGMAWALGLKLAFDNSYQWDFDSKPMWWARMKLESYEGNKKRETGKSYAEEWLERYGDSEQEGE